MSALTRPNLAGEYLLTFDEVDNIHRALTGAERDVDHLSGHKRSSSHMYNGGERRLTRMYRRLSRRWENRQEMKPTTRLIIVTVLNICLVCVILVVVSVIITSSNVYHLAQHELSMISWAAGDAMKDLAKKNNQAEIMRLQFATKVPGPLPRQSWFRDPPHLEGR